MTSRIWTLLAAVAAAVPGLAATPLATVERIAGPVDVRLAGSWQDASSGDKLWAGDAVRTGQRGYATLRDARGTVTELFPLATVEFPEDTVMGAIAGRIWTHFRKLQGLTREIRTPSAVALIRGTTLAVEATGGHTRVLVLEGLVEVRDPAGKTALVPDGYSIHADRDGLGRVERALDADLEEGRKFLERSREWSGLSHPAGSGALLPRFNVRPPAAVPAAAPAARRPSALERAEADFDMRSRGPVGPSHAGEPGPGMSTGRVGPRGRTPGGGAKTDAAVDAAGDAVDVGASAGARGQRVDEGTRDESRLRSESGDRRDPGAREPAARTGPGRADSPVRLESSARADVDFRTEPPRRSEDGPRVERPPLPGIDARRDAPVRVESPPVQEPAARSGPEDRPNRSEPQGRPNRTDPQDRPNRADPPGRSRQADSQAGPAAGAEPPSKPTDPTLEIEVRTRTDILGR